MWSTTLNNFVVGVKEVLMEAIDNDTLIIVGLICFAFVTTDADLQSLVVGGMLAYMGVKEKKK